MLQFFSPSPQRTSLAANKISVAAHHTEWALQFLISKKTALLHLLSLRSRFLSSAGFSQARRKRKKSTFAACYRSFRQPLSTLYALLRCVQGEKKQLLFTQRMACTHICNFFLTQWRVYSLPSIRNTLANCPTVDRSWRILTTDTASSPLWTLEVTLLGTNQIN